MSDAYTNLLTRAPANMPGGKAVRLTLAEGLGLQGVRVEAQKRDELSTKGRAQIVEKHLRTVAGPRLSRARRQLAYHQGKIERQRAAVSAKAIGQPDSLDAERRAVLRGLPEAERIQRVLSNPDFRGAALRGGADLSGLNSEVFARAMDIARHENAAPEIAALNTAEEAQELRGAAICMLEFEILQTPFLLEPSGAVRTATPHELEQWLSKNVPPVAAHTVMHEEIEADHVEEAA